MITDHLPMLKGLILDMDGVLWHDKEPIGNLAEIFAQIQKLGLDFVLATNNSSKTVEEFQQKIENFGIAVNPEQIITSAIATFQYLEEHRALENLVYVIGSESLIDDARKRGFRVLQVGEHRQADFVIVGIDQTLTYEKINFAAKQIRAGAKFVATNTDATYPTPNGLVPGAGTMVAAVQTASGQEPLIIGKPAPNLYNQALQIMGLKPDQVLCVGDRLATDILGAHNGGFKSAFLLSGVDSTEDLVNWEPKPDIIAKNLTDLIYG